MRVPQSPKSLRRVMTVSSVRSEEDEGAASSSSDDGSNTTSSKNTFKKSRSNNNNNNSDTSRPPRPTYTARYKDGKYTVGVEATLFAGKEDSVSENANNNNDDNDNSVKNANNECDAKKLLDGQAATSLPASFHRSRDRTRISAVQRLVERKLAQKERERLRERELERDRLAHHLSGKARSSSSNSCYVRERSWDATYHSSSSFGGRSFSASGPEKEKNTSGGRNEKQEQQLPKTRTEKENEYLASLLWRTSRSCSGTRRRVPQSDGEEEVAKTIITIGPGKPTRIREHSPSKRSPTSEHPPSNFGIGILHNINSTDNEENEDKPTPLKSVPVHRDSSPSKKSESLYKNTTPLKSTGLFREFAQTTRTTTTKTSDGKRKTSFTTEKTFQVNVDAEAEKARRLSIDCNYVYEKSTPTYSTFSQSDENQAPISSSTSSLASSFSSTSSADLSTEKEPIRLSRLRPATFNSPPTEKRTEPTPEPPIRERKTSRRIFISTAFNSNNNINNNNNTINHGKNDSCNDDTSSSVSNSSTEDNATTGSDGAGSPFSSASSRLLFNLSSGYRYHRAAAAASSTINSNNNNNNTRHININISTSNNKSFNSNNDAASYPRRRFSQEHLAQEDKDTFGGESVFVTRPLRQPVRKISLPVRPMREAASMRREATRWDDSSDLVAEASLDKMSDEGVGNITSSNCNGDGVLTTTATLNPWSKYKLCDDSLYYPGCCVEHDRLSLGEKSSSTVPSSPSQSTTISNYSTNTDLNTIVIGDGAKVSANLHAIQDNVYFYNDCPTSVSDNDSVISSHFASSEITESSYCSDTVSEIAEILSDVTVNDKNDLWYCKTPSESLEFYDIRDRVRDPTVFDANFTTLEQDCNDEDDQSLSTLSGSGMDFFRKLVQRKDQFEEDNNRCASSSTIKEGLFGRFISDSIQNQPISPLESKVQEEYFAPETRESSPGVMTEEGVSEFEVTSSISKRSSISFSTVSGSGLLYLRNVLRKKKSSVASRPPDDLRPESRQSSVGSSTLADLLNETFDSEDSELQKLDWEEFEDDLDVDEDLSECCELAEDDIALRDLACHYSSPKSVGNSGREENKHLENESAEKCQLNKDEVSMGVAGTSNFGLQITIDQADDDEEEDSGSPACSTAKNSPSIQSLNVPLDFVSLASATTSVQGFNKLNLVSGKEREALIRSMKENEPVMKLILSSPTTFTPKKKDFTPNPDSTPNSDSTPNPDLTSVPNVTEEKPKILGKELVTKRRLSNFWARCILQANQVEPVTYEDAASSQQPDSNLVLKNNALVGFRPAMPSYYSPETQSSANERIRLFLDATRRAAAESETSTRWIRTTSDDNDADNNDVKLTERYFRLRQIHKRCSVVSVASSFAN